MLLLQSLSRVQVVEELCVRTWWLFLLRPRVVLFFEFSSDVFKKEKVSLAGRDEVGHAGLVVFGCLSTGDRGCKF
jgi:hypothetical protein